MKPSIYTALLLITLPAFAETGLAGINGSFYSFGAGISPIYIEEIVSDDALAGGATVTSLNGEARYGLVFKNQFAVYGLTSQNLYTDSESQVYITGLTGLGIQYFPAQFFDTYFLLGAGLGSKVVFTEDELLSATGSGFQLGVGRSFTRKLSFEANYKYLSLSEPTLTFISGDTESVSSVQLSLHYLLR